MLWLAALAVPALGCGSGAGTSLARAEAEAVRDGLVRGTVTAGPFVLLRFLRAPAGAETLAVYLDGDAAAWHRDGIRVSAEPPPLHPLALELAARDPAPAVAWLGRPCQPALPEAPAACRPALWGHERFSQTVVDALQTALDVLRQESGAARLELVGYSGGGVLAMLLAAARDDVVRVVTVAAPLALEVWIRHHGLGRLDARDPADLAPAALSRMIQIHWAGGRDEVVPASVLEAYGRRHPESRVERVPDRGHADWAGDWAERIAAARLR